MSKNEILRNRIWKELYDARHSSLYMAALIRRHRVRVRIYDIVIAGAAVAGTLLSTVEVKAPLIATIAIAVGASIKAIRPSWFMSETQLASADIRHQFYESYSARLEKLWIEAESELITVQDGLERFFQLKETEQDHIIPTNQLCAFFTINTDKVQQKADEYVHSVFYPGPQTTEPTSSSEPTQ